MSFLWQSFITGMNVYIMIDLILLTFDILYFYSSPRGAVLSSQDPHKDQLYDI